MPEDIGLMAHLLRRAGFGATRAELEAYAAKGYETTVEELLYRSVSRTWSTTSWNGTWKNGMTAQPPTPLGSCGSTA
jgi:hypothetical protein